MDHVNLIKLWAPGGIVIAAVRQMGGANKVFKIFAISLHLSLYFQFVQIVLSHKGVV